MEGVLIVKELFSRSGHLHSFGEGYHKWIFLIFGVSALHTACMFSGCACDVCDTGVHAHRLLRHEQEHTHTHTHTDIKLAYSSLCSLFLPPHLLS